MLPVLCNLSSRPLPLQGHPGSGHSQAILARSRRHREALQAKAASGLFLQVVGVVQDGKYRGVVESPSPHFYLPLSQSYVPLRTFHVRTSVRPENLAMQVQSQIRSLAPNLSISELQTMNQALQGVNGFLFYRLGAQFASAMGLLGLVLAVVGVYSVASYAATHP
jgi:hypothetical protein